MKKIFTLTIALVSIGSVFAQSGRHNDAKEVVVTRQKSVTVIDHKNDYSLSAKDKDAQIQKINKDYSKQIRAIQKNRSLKSYEKQRQIRILEAEKDRKIKEVNDRYSDRHNRYNNHKW